MHQDSTTRARTSARARKHTSLVLTGPTRLTVERGRLRAEDGYANLGTRRCQEFDSPHSLESVILLSDGASLSDHALRMLTSQGACLYRLRQTGEMEYAVTPGTVTCKPSLLRMQARLRDLPDGLEIARWLVSLKVERQEETLAWISRRETLPGLEEYAKVTELGAPSIQEAASVEELMLTEARAADLYFRAWAGFPVSFRRMDKGCIEVPAHWKSFQGRASIKSGGNRHATDPVNALLNFGYAIAAAEVLIAIRAAGLEPCLGVLHADRDGRASFVYDLIEPLRPVVDRLLLERVHGRGFKMNHDFVLLQDGVCRLGVELAAEIAELLVEKLRPEAETVVLEARKRISDAAEQSKASAPVLPFRPLLPARESEEAAPLEHASATVEEAPASGEASESPELRAAPEAEPADEPVRKERKCRTCGKLLSSKRQYCRACCSERRAEVVRKRNAEAARAREAAVGAPIPSEAERAPKRSTVRTGKLHLAIQYSRSHTGINGVAVNEEYSGSERSGIPDS